MEIPKQYVVIPKQYNNTVFNNGMITIFTNIAIPPPCDLRSSLKILYPGRKSLELGVLSFSHVSLKDAIPILYFSSMLKTERDLGSKLHILRWLKIRPLGLKSYIGLGNKIDKRGILVVWYGVKTVLLYLFIKN